ncbi:MAG: NAD(P)-dependent glycerol-3-phosphate dehydrogenase [Myxococcales bacterium]|nr:NAD(P)-dependent glycerol-3-phosphate dehydrogenase [Myxococcales bacterium]
MGSADVAVVGAGSWGTALAMLLANQGRHVRLWARRHELADAINGSRINDAYLPGVRLPDSLTATTDLEETVNGSKLVLFVVPSHVVRSVLASAVPHLPKGVPMLCAIKGIEGSSLKLISQIFEEHVAPDQHGYLTYLGGPSFAGEVARGMPTVVSVAGRDTNVTREVQEALSTERFRAYTTEDVVGVELGGALKNVIAIAAGISDGLGFGHNSRAALITRGLSEMGKLGAKLGADPLTLAGLGGMGDLVLTCTGDLSRNRTVGLRLGKGERIDEIVGSMRMVAEGVRTAESAHRLAEREEVEMPIVHEIYRILYEQKAPMAAVQDLMTRPLKPERA